MRIRDRAIAVFVILIFSALLGLAIYGFGMLFFVRGAGE